MSIGKLLLHPQSTKTEPPSRGTLTGAMQRLGFFGQPIGGHQDGPRFFAGERFLQLITFLGCSPHIDLAPPDDGNQEFCYLEVLGPWKRARFLQGRNTRPPGCPVCRSKNAAWRSWLEPQRTETEMGEWICAACGNRTEPSRWNWRQQAGFGLIFIQINSIFPSEAVPTEELMSALEKLSGGPWQYFYIQD